MKQLSYMEVRVVTGRRKTLHVCYLAAINQVMRNTPNFELIEQYYSRIGEYSCLSPIMYIQRFRLIESIPEFIDHAGRTRDHDSL